MKGLGIKNRKILSIISQGLVMEGIASLDTERNAGIRQLAKHLEVVSVDAGFLRASVVSASQAHPYASHRVYNDPLILRVQAIHLPIVELLCATLNLQSIFQHCSPTLFLFLYRQ